MSFTVRLYKFDKRPDSTKRPAATDTYKTVDCTLKSAASVTNPILNLNLSSADALGYNYMYIPEFKRYYFIDDIVYTGGIFIWDVYAHVDVLATYYNDITSSTQYIARSSVSYDQNIIDTMYLSKASNTTSRCAVSAFSGSVYEEVVGEGSPSAISYFNRSYSAGAFVVGVAGSGTNANGATYYKMTYSVFKEFIQKAFALDPSDMSDVSNGVASAIFSPLDYIISVRWFPSVKVPAGASGTTTIRIGRYAVSITNTAYILNANNVVEYSITMSVPQHPQSSGYRYLNLSPYTDIYLYFQPFGNIPLDTLKLYGASSIEVRWYTDYISGSALLQIAPNTAGEDDYLIYTDTADFGVPISISALSYSIEGGALAAAANIVADNITHKSAMSYSEQFKDSNFIMKALAANADFWYGTAAKIVNKTDNTDTIGKVADAVSASLGRLQTKGVPGSFLMYNSGEPFIYAWFRTVTQMDDSRFGRPYYQTNSLYNVKGGYVVCVNASITSFTGTVPTAAEYSALIQYLNSGIYLE
jgi:hypothetical protein